MSLPARCTHGLCSCLTADASLQAAVGHPLTVYGKGGQTRGFLDIRDTVRLPAVPNGIVVASLSGSGVLLSAGAAGARVLFCLYGGALSIA